MNASPRLLLLPLLLIIQALLLIVSDARGAEVRALSLDFNPTNDWRLSADKPWWALVDLRNILTLFHPFTLPQSGGAAGASRTVILPSACRPPLALRFYCADDYFADAEKHKPGILGTESFFSHRFKQVLIDDQVVWERDVIDENKHGSPTQFQLDISSWVTPGKPFQLTFRAWDKVTTLERHPQDIWFRGGTWYGGGDAKTEQEPRFHTSIWFADPVLGEKEAVEAMAVGKRPHETVVRERHLARWPMAPRGELLPFPTTFRLVSPATIPAPGFPLTCGIPMPSGVVTNLRSLRLTDGEGRELPIQLTTTATWPDGSVRWVTLETILRPGTAVGAPFRLHHDPSPPPSQGISSGGRLLVTRQGREVTVDTGALRLRCGGDPARWIDSVALPGKGEPLMTALAPRMSVLFDGVATPVAMAWDRMELETNGPVSVTVSLNGNLTTDGRGIGRFVYRVRAFAGLPTLLTQVRIFNDLKPVPYLGTADDAPLAITDFALVAGLADSPWRTRMGLEGAPEWEPAPGPVRVLQATPENVVLRELGVAREERGHGAGWIATAGPAGNVQASVWRWWQQYPKSFAFEKDRLELGLFTPTVGIADFRPRFGEAKRHDIWLTFSTAESSAEERRAHGRLADESPRLFEGDWFCRGGGMNVLDPHWFEHQPRLKEWVRTSYGDVSSARVTGHFGIRDFGDMPYGSQGQWLNGYWALVQGPLNWGLASGDSRWFERGFEIARHLADIDAVHIPPGHPDWHDWDGLTCALGHDHSVHNNAARWPAFQMGEALLLHHWLTGDRDSREAGLANADMLLRNLSGLGSVEARSQARPMLTLLRAWQATGDRKYFEGARRYFDLRFQITNVLEWRRGAYIQPTYENWRCISAGLDSMYAHNVYEFYRLTGDVDAAQLVIAIADSVYAESMLPQEEGLGSFLYYVRYDRGSSYYTQMAMLFYMAYDLTEDVRFLRAGRAAFRRYQLCTNAAGQPQYQPVHNFGWLDPEFGGWLREFEHVPTTPIQISSQTPVPDPAQYAK